SNISPYITSKFNNFISNDYMRVIIGQTKSSFDFREIMDEGKILLVDLSKGRIGQLNSNLLGMIIVGKILISAFSREDIAQQDRRDFSLYIDEFQNFTTDSIATILAEARKYGLSIIMAHQYIAQLEDSIKNAVFGNVGSKISFRVGAPDAEALIKEFEPTLTTEDLVSIDNFHAYVKLLINGVTTKPFNIKTLRAPAPDLKRAQIIKDISLKKYGRSREEVERDILRRLRN
ncbi:MAG: TraM recognition domain-containing protein, partial [Candidatus Paceibacterota bacterium]